MNRHVRIILKLSILIAAICAFLYLGLTMPVGITAKVKEPDIYQYEDVTKSDLVVSVKSLLKRTWQIHDYEIANADQDTINISYRTFNTSLSPKRILLDRIEAVYNADAYEYEPLDTSSVTVNLVYEDGITMKVDDFSIDFDESFGSSEVTVPITTAYGTAEMKITPIPLQYVKAEYKYKIHVGETFEKENVVVTAVYKDGKQVNIPSFSFDNPNVVKEKMTIPVKTDYGTANLILDPVPVKEISASYTKTIYEGETPEKSAVSAKLIYEDDTEMELHSFDIDGIEKIYDEVKLPVSTEYGSATVTITPVKVKEISSDAGTVEAGGQFSIHTITFTYEDGTTKDINVNDVTFLDDVSQKEIEVGENLFPFEYDGHTYTLVINAVESQFAGYTIA